MGAQRKSLPMPRVEGQEDSEERLRRNAGHGGGRCTAVNAPTDDNERRKRATENGAKNLRWLRREPEAHKENLRTSNYNVKTITKTKKALSPGTTDNDSSR